ncbi:hypothetical protein EYF80_064191 [Liparis tanakae]|uniref:Uncharacterized protein n=1 Tax=Liparis tanakae TaxID=230148 RepID=A0A4Z2EA22_9TELE|nr:hypothetical protein EYF80_064191 [Liparis tanakae]
MGDGLMQLRQLWRQGSEVRGAREHGLGPAHMFSMQENPGVDVVGGGRGQTPTWAWPDLPRLVLIPADPQQSVQRQAVHQRVYIISAMRDIFWGRNR